MAKIVKLLAQAMGIGEADLKAKIETDGTMPEGDELEAALAAEVRAHVADVKRAQHQRGVKETAKKFRAKVLENWSDAPDDVTDDLELLEKFVEAQKGGTGAKPGADKETLLKDATVKQIVAEAVNAQKQRFADMEANFKKQVAQKESEMAAHVASATLGDLLAKHKVILGEDEATQTARRDTIRKLVNLNRIGLKDGKPVILGDDGEPATDDAGRVITYEQKVLEAATPFGFHKQDPKKAGAGAGAGGGAKPGEKGEGEKYKFGSEAELNDFLKTTADPKARKEAIESFMADDTGEGEE